MIIIIIMIIIILVFKKTKIVLRESYSSFSAGFKKIRIKMFKFLF